VGDEINEGKTSRKEKVNPDASINERGHEEEGQKDAFKKARTKEGG